MIDRETKIGAIRAYMNTTRTLYEVASIYKVSALTVIQCLEDGDLIRAAGFTQDKVIKRDLLPYNSHPDWSSQARIVYLYVTSHLTAREIAKRTGLHYNQIRTALRDREAIEEAGLTWERVRKIGAQKKGTLARTTNTQGITQLLKGFIQSQKKPLTYIETEQLPEGMNPTTAYSLLLHPPREVLTELGLSETQFYHYIKTAGKPIELNPIELSRRLRNETVAEIARDLAIPMTTVRKLVNHLERP